MNRISQGSVDDSRRLILIRHAHRDNSNRQLDNGLSTEGLAQATKIARYWATKIDSKGAEWLTSPKARCVETLLPLAGHQLRIQPLLDEQGGEETARQLDSRIDQFILELDKISKNQIFACSHGDWIPQFVQKTCGLSTELSKGGWIVLKFSTNPSRWVIENAVLSPDLIPQ